MSTGTVRTLLNGTLVLLLAKFVLNDVPHAGLSSTSNRWKVSIERTMFGADVIPGAYTASQVPGKVRELMVTAPPILEAIHIFAAEELEEKPGPFLPILPMLKDPKRLWVVDVAGDMGNLELGTVRAFLVPELVREHLLALQEGEVMRVYPY